MTTPRPAGDGPRTDTAEGLRHEHVWSPWGCWVRRWDSMGTTVVSESYVTLQGGTPITPGWTRTCATCGVEQSR